jgi:hypothetical protein
MDYGDWPDEEAKRFARAVEREKRALQRNRKRRQVPLWQRCVAAVIMATALWVVGEIAIYESEHINLPRPLDPTSVTTTPAPHPATTGSHS